jgi:hypothetical protein
MAKARLSMRKIKKVLRLKHHKRVFSWDKLQISRSAIRFWQIKSPFLCAVCAFGKIGNESGEPLNSRKEIA